MATAVAFSGGKDSTAMALRLAERGEDFVLLFTPAGNELPELFAHVAQIAALVGKPLIQPPNQTLAFWIDHHQALPNHRMRWCTRQIKIQPCIDWLVQHPGSTLCVGLRADEEARVGLYGDYCTYRYPLREEGWDEASVYGYLRQRGVTVPARTNCAVCYGQRLSEWWELWHERPDEYAQGEAWETQTGHTFRSDQRDTWPAGLADLRVRFEAGDVPRGVELTGSLFEDGPTPCRACTL
jgi:hypothetical protein